jgi:ketosteroid isomerase-like protein
MQSNDFTAAARWLAEDFENYAPQSSEVIRGRANFANINTHYPANGQWQFRVNQLVAQGDQVVTDVSITDGTVAARAITFHTVANGLITRQTEFWPDDYPAPAWRAAWVSVEDRGRCNQVPGT